jgi:hypothetical protein
MMSGDDGLRNGRAGIEERSTDAQIFESCSAQLEDAQPSMFLDLPSTSARSFSRTSLPSACSQASFSACDRL